MKKTALLSTVLIMAGFLAATAQNNISIQKYLNRPNAGFENSKLSTPQRTNSGQDWWEPDTVYCFLTGADEEPQFADRFIFKYNSSGLLEEDFHQFWVNNSWSGMLNTYTYTYDSNNNVLTKLAGNNSLSTYTYNLNNNVLTELMQDWSDNSWINSSLYACTYDSNNNLLTRLHQNWKNNSWENVHLYTYTYDSDNNVLTELSQKWQNDSWVDAELNTYTYDSNDNVLTRSDGHFSISTYTYDENNNRLTELIQMLPHENMGLITYTYDSNNNRITELHQKWQNNSWQNMERYQRTYDENRNGTSVEFWRWAGESWQPENNLAAGLKLYYNNMKSSFLGGDYKMTASYVKTSDFTSIAKPPTSPELNTISIYPNPSKGELRITNYETTFDVSQLRIENIRIFDISGINVFSTQQTTSDISHLPAGTYFVQITTEKGIVVKKIVKW